MLQTILDDRVAPPVEEPVETVQEVHVQPAVDADHGRSGSKIHPAPVKMPARTFAHAAALCGATGAKLRLLDLSATGAGALTCANPPRSLCPFAEQERPFAGIERKPGFVKLQRLWRSKTAGPGGLRLNAKNLAARCLFESKLMSGLFSLFVQLGIFLLLLAALGYTGNPPAKRGVYTNLRTYRRPRLLPRSQFRAPPSLVSKPECMHACECAEDSFDFDSLWAIKSRDAFVEALGRLSSSYKKYFLLSPLYFDTRGQGDVQLIGNFQKFTQPIAASGFDLTIRAPTISLTAWIKIRPQFQSGYIIRKRPSSSGVASDLSCWAWLLDAQSGPKFVLGAHDFSPRNASHMKSKLRQV